MDYVIADIHGCAKTLTALVRQLSLQPEDKLYFLGDYIDRGPGSKQVLDYLMQLSNPAYFLVGNHEEYMLASIDAEEERQQRFSWFRGQNRALHHWKSYGGNATLRSFGVDNPLQIEPKYIDFLRQMRSNYYVELEHHILVHAGFDFSQDDVFANKHAMTHIEDFSVNPEKVHHKTIIHGHMSVSLEFTQQLIAHQHTNHYIDIDSGCVYQERQGQGFLNAFCLQTNQLISQHNIDIF